jgi:phosphopantetheine adenylyltransferase
MKAITWGVMVVIGITASGFAAEKKTEDIEAIRAELKPLRQKAYKETDVKAARAQLDAAYRKYWQTVRTAMLRLEPKKAALIEKDIASREAAPAVSAAAR